MTLQPNVNVRDTTERLAWGWIATLHGLDQGPWMDPTAAARLLDVSSATLRYWADHAVITCIRPEERGHHRRYFGPELVKILQITGYQYPPVLRTLREHIDSMVGGG